ncbi:hypothetical protein C8F04DRAFT_1281913 [Mycena alexandri]|uniref:Uncharacterized protein n=1 Tax=Mycena alexandri TaxID=1745969 RepID=A0AAD6RXH4_9AGAR|nr:hypothetical protein C8F04DRAFT_1281913 [Mycena alexandri]
MAPPTWSTPEQLEWLKARVGAYLENKKTGDQIEFFVGLDEAWFKKWPEEGPAGLPGRESGVALTPDQNKILADALEARRKASLLLRGRSSRRKRQIRSWFRNHTRSQRESGVVAAKKADPGSMAAALWKDQTRHRNPQLVELYQKFYPERVKEGLEVAGFQAKHARDLEFVSLDDETPAEEIKIQLKTQASARLSARRAVSRTLLAEEEDEIKQRLEEELNKIKSLKLEGKTDEKLTPESAQRSLDQLEGIVDRFHQILREKTGWVGFTMVGGPTPNAGGALSMQVFSSGLTPAGHTFKQVHPDWKGAVSLNFTEFLRRCFARSERDAMALPEPDEPEEEDLLAMSDEEEAPSPPPKSVAPKRKSALNKKTSTLAPAVAPAMTTSSSAAAPLPAVAADLNASLESQTAYLSNSIVAPALPTATESAQTLNSSATDTSSWNTFDWNTYDNFMDTGEDLQGMMDAENPENSALAGNGAVEPWLRDGSALKTHWWLNRNTEGTDVLHANAAETQFFGGAGGDLSGTQDTTHHSANVFIAPVSASQRAWRAWPPSPTPPAPAPTAAAPAPTAAAPAPTSPAPAPTSPAPAPTAAAPAATPPAPTATPPAPSTARSRIPAASASPLPPRLLRTASSTAAISSSTAALKAVMAKSRVQEDAGDESGGDSDTDMPLAAAGGGAYASGEGSDNNNNDIPISRPMANVPKPATRGRGGAAARRGAARGAARGAGGGAARGAGGGGGGGATDGGSGRRGGQNGAVDRGEGGSGGGQDGGEDGVTQGGDGGGDDREADSGEGGSQGARPVPKPLYRFRQTYGDNGEVIPLPLDAPDGRLPPQQMKDIRQLEKARDKKASAPKPKPRQLGVYCLPRPPGGPMPPIPKLGPPGRFNQERENAKQEAALGSGRGAREKRAPKNPNEEAALLEARVREAKGKKRKVDDRENDGVSADAPRKRGRKA